MKTLSILILLVVLSSCMPTKTMYYWGNYEKTYYEKVKNPSDEANVAHIETLKKIIEKTKNSSTKNIGPGIFAEYGYTLLLNGKTEDAAIYFLKEKETFPISNTIVNFISK
jgi:hypothetical protein